MDSNIEVRQTERVASRRTLRVCMSALAIVAASVSATVLALLVSADRHPGAVAPLPAWPQSTSLLHWAHGPARASVTVRFRRGVSSSEQQRLLRRLGAVETGRVPALGLHVVSIAPAKAEPLLHRLRLERTIAEAAPDDVRQISATVSDPAFSSQWALERIGWRSAFLTVKPKRQVTIAVVDTGVDGTNPDFAGRLMGGFSAFGSNAVTDPHGHGTWMASIAAATANNGRGIAGVAFAGARIMPVQVLNAQGYGRDSDIVKGVVWAADHGAGVILMSFSGAGYSPALQSAVDYAWSKGAVVIAATGNNGSSAATYPAGDEHVVGVSATDAADNLWSGSNFGPAAFIAAPGVGIPVDAVGGGTTTITGTSASAAFVAGSAALLLAADPKASNRLVIGKLAESADHAGTREQTANGRLNLGRALRRVAAPLSPVGVGDRHAGGPFAGPYVAAASTAGTPVAIGANNSNNGTNTVAITSSVAVPVGSTILVSAAENNATNGTWSAVDSKSNTYTADINASALVNVGMLHSYVTTALAVNDTITVTFPVAGNQRRALSAYYVKGLIQTSPLEKTGLASNTASPFTVTSSATTQAIQHVAAVFGQSGVRTYSSPTCTQGTDAVSGGGLTLTPWWTNVTTAGAKTCSANLSGAANWDAGIATFKVDIANPTAAITFPAAGAFYNAAGWSTISGTAADTTGGAGVNSALTSVAVSIHDDTANKYWTGAAWGAAGGAEVYNTATGTTVWTYTLANTNLIDASSYTVHAQSTDDATNISTVASRTFTYDTTIPTNAFSLQSVSTWTNSLGTFPNAYYSGSGTNIYYNGSGGSGAKSLTIRAAVTDATSGGASVTTSAFANGGSNMTHTDATTSTPGSGNFDTNAYTFTPTTSGTAASTVMTNDAAGNASANANFSLVNDVTGPTGGAVTVNGTAASGGGSSSYLNSGTTVTINSRTDYSADAGSGLNASTLTYQSATLSANACGSYGSATTVPPAQTNVTVTTGNCYLFTLVGTDHVGNSSVLTTTAKVDTTTPSNPTYTLSEPVSDQWEYISGTTLFFNKNATGSHTFRVDAATSDSASDIADVTFSAPTGLSCVSSCAVDTTSPYQQDYTWDSSTNSANPANVGQSHDNAALASTQTGITLTADTTAPSQSITFPTGAGPRYGSDGWNTITGTTDDGTGSQTSAVGVSIQDTTVGGNSCYNGAGSFNQPCPNYLSPGGTLAGWTYAVASANLTDGHSYTISAQATDNVNNSGTTSQSFTYDTSPATMSSATVAADGVTVTVTWSENLDQTMAVSGSAFSIAPNGGAGIAVVRGFLCI